MQGLGTVTRFFLRKAQYSSTQEAAKSWPILESFTYFQIAEFQRHLFHQEQAE
jgi:hypothetical protein